MVQCEKKGISGASPFKQIVLKSCDARNDSWSREMSMRCHGVHDLAAAEAQYHVRCYNSFRKIPRMRSEQVVAIEDEALLKLIDKMFANRKLGTLTTIDLHDKYTCYGGKLTLKQMLSKLLRESWYLTFDGCASVIGFQECLGKILKVAKVLSEDDEMEDTLVQKIVTEASKIPSNKDYDLNEFSYTKVKEQTSATLLRFIYKLVSNGEITKPSLSLSQSIQQHISSTQNQTTLGLGIKLHHKFGSRELIDILHENGYVASYQEVRRFRKSEAQYVSNNTYTLHQMMRSISSAGLVFGWFDNFYLLVTTPNGCRETHAMATEFQMHPARDVGSSPPALDKIVIPRLTSNQAKLVGKDKAVPLVHYTGPKKVKPPAMATITIGISYKQAHAQ